jgi:hypothetical protein
MGRNISCTDDVSAVRREPLAIVSARVRLSTLAGLRVISVNLNGSQQLQVHSVVPDGEVKRRTRPSARHGGKQGGHRAQTGNARR